MAWLVTISAENALRIMMGSRMLQNVLIVKEANSILGYMNSSTISRLKEVIIPLYSAFITASAVFSPAVQQRN